MKKRPQLLFIGLAIMAGVHQTTAQVTNPAVAPVGQQSIIYWPNSPTNYVLQTVTNLTSTNWMTVRTAYAVNLASVSNAGPAGYFRLQPVTVPAGMALIPAGWFTMGDTLDGDNNAIPTNVYVSPFVMDVNLVNYGFWTNVYEYATNSGYNFKDAGLNGAYDYNGSQPTGTNSPVTFVDWYDCVKWCNARSQQANLTPCYYTDTNWTQVYTNGEPLVPTSTKLVVYVNWSANGYRLPTEAEWEKAARGGGVGRRFPWGDFINTNQAAYDGADATADASTNYDMSPTGYYTSTTPVGSFDVNGYGLYDMAGNIFEWCWDWYGTPYGQPSAINPTGAGQGSSEVRVIRGGNWSASPINARCACRIYSDPAVTNNGDNSFGFRCVMGL